jgi:hypothetical protein
MITPSVSEAAFSLIILGILLKQTVNISVGYVPHFYEFYGMKRGPRRPFF